MALKLFAFEIFKIKVFSIQILTFALLTSCLSAFGKDFHSQFTTTTNLVVSKWTPASLPCSSGKPIARRNVRSSGSLHPAHHPAPPSIPRKRTTSLSRTRAQLSNLREGTLPARQALPAREATWPAWPARRSRWWGARRACPSPGGRSASAWTRRAGLGARMFVLWQMTQANEC